MWRRLYGSRWPERGLCDYIFGYGFDFQVDFYSFAITYNDVYVP